MSAEPGGLPEVRASHEDRERVVDVLRVAAGDGRLTPEELDERLEGALSARTVGELAGLTADLVTRPGTAAAQAKDVVRIDQRYGSVARDGRWIVPRQLDLRASWCNVTLDFSRATITHGSLVIDMRVRGGSLILVTRPGIVVDTDALRVRYTDLRIRPADDAPLLLSVQLTGRMRYGHIETREAGT